MAVLVITSINTSIASAFDVPQPTYPGNFSETTPTTDPPLGVPSFSWLEISGATKYRLQVDNDIYFNSPIFINITTLNTSYTPGSMSFLLADGEWYWRVRVEEPTPVGAWSEIMTFTKSWATVENRPTLVAPADNAILAFFNAPNFSWTPVIGATKYRFQIATSPDGFPSPILSVETLNTTIQPNNRLENGEYYWRVVPEDAVLQLGTSSEIHKFTMAYGMYTTSLVPVQLEPTDESFPTFTPILRWTAVVGAEHYRLEYTSEENCDFSVGTSLDTRQTFYSPTDTFLNNARYCWHVRVDSGLAVGDWSETWHFQKRWYLQPQLLTPTNLFQNGLYPIYSWTPVPGASRYKIEIAENPSFNPIFETSTTANTTYSPQSNYDGSADYYWRVTPIDGEGNFGLTSSIGEFRRNYNSTTPILIYPLYYYIPNDPIYYGEYSMNPVEDRTVPYPIFIWHRVMIPSPNGGVFATAYRIQVDTSPYFNNIVWQHDTENTSVTPIDRDDFSPLVGQDYFWRVCVLDHIGGNCRTDPNSGWSQIWKARFDPSLALTPTKGNAPVLIRPAHGQESVETTPLLEWWPFQSKTQIQYQVEASRDANFETYEISETVNIPLYSPSVSIVQRSLGRTDYGTFYWRVRGFDGDKWSAWSDTWRFQIASQSDWRNTRSLGNVANKLLIGDDLVGDSTDTYDLTTFYASQSNTNWFLGFNANLTTPDMTYVFYIDLDHVDGSGASIPPPERPYIVTTVTAHQPEYAIFVDKIGGVINAQNTWVFAWEETKWGSGQNLSSIGGLICASSDYVELQLPNRAIGMSQVTSSASILLFSVDPTTGELVDSVPSDPQVPEEVGNTPQLSRFSAVSDQLNLIFPLNSVTGDPRTLSSLLPFYWDWPSGSSPSTPFAGSNLEIHLDPNYTSKVAEFSVTSNSSYFGENNYTLLDDIIGDYVYYWRVRPRYWISGTPAFGAWTRGWSFRRLGFTAKDLQTSVSWATPTFNWDMVEGASTYRLQVSTYPNFSSTIINQVTPLTSYTPSTTLAQGVYYWRVQVIRYDGIVNGWSNVEQFTLSLPTPTGLIPDGNPPPIVQYAPTFCWDPIKSPISEPLLTAWKYRVQISRVENFSTIYETIDTSNICWTPTKGYDDGTYYWHVAMIDGNGNLGNYSFTATFIKQYPVTELISPIGGPIPATPTFIWTPVDGAATYLFEISKYSTFSPIYDKVETINTQFTPTKTYDSNTLYFWRVAIKDRNGKQGPFTDATISIGVEKNIYLPLIMR